jgi:hypothetical protein
MTSRALRLSTISFVYAAISFCFISILHAQTTNNYYFGDSVGRDKVGRDNVGRDNVGRDSVGRDNTGRDSGSRYYVNDPEPVPSRPSGRYGFSARAHCSITGITGIAYGMPTPEVALEMAVENCIDRGGIPRCCSSDVQLIR